MDFYQYQSSPVHIASMEDSSDAGLGLDIQDCCTNCSCCVQVKIPRSRSSRLSPHELGSAIPHLPHIGFLSTLESGLRGIISSPPSNHSHQTVDPLHHTQNTFRKTDCEYFGHNVLGLDSILSASLFSFGHWRNSRSNSSDKFLNEIQNKRNSSEPSHTFGESQKLHIKLQHKNEIEDETARPGKSRSVKCSGNQSATTTVFVIFALLLALYVHPVWCRRVAMEEGHPGRPLSLSCFRHFGRRVHGCVRPFISLLRLYDSHVDRLKHPLAVSKHICIEYQMVLLCLHSSLKDCPTKKNMRRVQVTLDSDWARDIDDLCAIQSDDATQDEYKDLTNYIYKQKSSNELNSFELAAQIIQASEKTRQELEADIIRSDRSKDRLENTGFETDIIRSDRSKDRLENSGLETDIIRSDRSKDQYETSELEDNDEDRGVPMFGEETTYLLGLPEWDEDGVSGVTEGVQLNLVNYIKTYNYNYNNKRWNGVGGDSSAEPSANTAASCVVPTLFIKFIVCVIIFFFFL